MGDGTVKAPYVSGNVTLALKRIWQLKDALFLHKWYGIKLALQPSGQCETTFNYDEHCDNDPTYYDE